MEVPYSDINFYERKIQRLEEDTIFLQEELTAAKVRLRITEDYQMKYELLLRQSQNQTQRIRMQEIAQDHSRDQEYLAIIKQNDEKWNQILNDTRFQLSQSNQKDKKESNAKYEELSKKYNEIHAKKQEMELFTFKLKKYEKQNDSLRDQIQEMKIHFEKQKEEQLTSLKTHLNNAHRDKIANIKAVYEEKIQKLEKNINQLEIKKDEEQIRVSPASNIELQKMRELLDEKHRDFLEELEKLRKQLERKNGEIKKIMQDNIENEEKNLHEQAQKRSYIKQLENKLFDKQKQHELEIINLIERMRRVKQQQLEQIKKQQKRQVAVLLAEKDTWSSLQANHKDEIAGIKKQYEDEKNKYLEERNQLKKKISELSNRLREVEGEREVGDTQMFINSLKDLDSKEEQFGNYENGIVFLERQLKKKGLKLEEKNREISKLNQELSELKKENENEINELKDKYRKQKKEANQKNHHLESQVRDLNDTLRNKERDLKKKEKDTTAERLELEQQNRELKQFVEELQRDYNRVIENKKNVENSYRDQREKGITSKTDINIIRRQKWLELEKQKNELDIIFREKQNQIRMEKDAEIDKLQTAVNKLKHSHEIAVKENELLKKEKDRLCDQLEINKENDKHVDYAKKMATLNLEIALTQNIYDSLLKAKSRVHVQKSGLDSQKAIIAQFSVEPQVRDACLFESFNPAAHQRP